MASSSACLGIEHAALRHAPVRFARLLELLSQEHNREVACLKSELEAAHSEIQCLRTMLKAEAPLNTSAAEDGAASSSCASLQTNEDVVQNLQTFSKQIEEPLLEIEDGIFDVKAIVSDTRSGDAQRQAAANVTEYSSDEEDNGEQEDEKTQLQTEDETENSEGIQEWADDWDATTNDATEIFVKRYNLDAKVAGCLRWLSPTARDRVLAGVGGIEKARNPSAFIWKVMRKEREVQTAAKKASKRCGRSSSGPGSGDPRAITPFEGSKEPAWHRRQRKKRGEARALLRVVNAVELLSNHGSTQRPSRRATANEIARGNKHNQMTHVVKALELVNNHDSANPRSRDTIITTHTAKLLSDHHSAQPSPGSRRSHQWQAGVQANWYSDKWTGKHTAWQSSSGRLDESNYDS